MSQIVTATQARNNFGDILNQVQYLGQEFIVKKQGKPIAFITAPTKPRQTRKTKALTGTDFLLKLSTFGLKGAPKDLARNLDKHVWE